MKPSLLLLVLFILLLGVAPVAAQNEEEPEPGPTATAGLPNPEIFGEGWVQAEVVSPASISRYSGFEMTPDIFREGAAGIYLGPEGSRAIIVNLLISSNRVAVRASWDSASDLLRTLTRLVSTDYERDAQLETMAPPENCVEAKRVEGSEEAFRLNAGATLCAPDDDSLLLAIIYGPVNGLTGVDASDMIVNEVSNGAIGAVSTPG